MDPYSSSGEILNIKTRKPYTITKQRERWTEEEHNSFLEALKLYGRAWQRIEEHIGTKTAVQIRSHAQKFFTKLEKEAVAKGVPTRQALDMEIPPPRPKRKPNYPYPRKSHQPSLKPIPDPQTTTNEHEEKQENAKTNEEMEKKEMSCASLSSENENNSRELMKNLDETNKSYMTTDQCQNPRGGNYPRHVHVQVVDGSQGVITGEEESTVNIASCSSYPPAFPFTPFSDNQFLHVSSTISSLIVSSLLQNPAAHAAATFAAKFWHDSSSSRDHDSPSMAAIAAATVAAATAWWAAHGLVPHPVCLPPPPPPPFSFPVAAATSEREKPPENLTTKEIPPVVGVGGVGVGKQVDRSSCGSNTTSSSEIETDALEKNVKEKEETKGGGSDVANDSVSRSRVRNTTVNPNESWKEVSEEGRLAFQALFSRQVLPQSFSDRHNNNNNNNMNSDGLDLNRMSHQLLRGEERLLTIGLGHTHTGFKPYKRCSMEAAKEKTKIQIVGPSDDKGAKRMRFEADK